ncbi:MAG: hypothetical protein PVG07_10670, partial [Acidobacteriota bacterium]
VNGSSLVIWSWGPPLLLALVRVRNRPDAALEEALGAGAERIRGILVILYVVVTAVMTALPYAAGWRGDPVTAFLLGNRYHLVATGVGVLFAFLWRRRITVHPVDS